MANRVQIPLGKLPLLDDQERALAKNGLAAVGSLVGKEADLLERIAYSGRPLFTWIGGDSTTINKANCFRQVFNNQHSANVDEYTWLHYLEGTAARVNTQGLTVSIDSSTTTTNLDYSTSPTPTYATDIKTLTARTAFGLTSTGAKELVFGSATANGPQLRSGLFLSAGQFQVVPGEDTCTLDAGRFAQNHEILGIETGATTDKTLTRFRNVYLNTWRYRRPQFGWSAINPGTGYVEFSTSKSDYRYIFDQTYGTNGTAIGAGTPAMTMPLEYSAAGLRTQIRVYVFVYAAMSSGTGTGTLAVANKNASGTMASTPTALTNNVSISGTSFAWYPSLSTALSSCAYFTAYAGTTFDRVALCARNSGGEFDGNVRIGAFTMIPIHVA